MNRINHLLRCLSSTNNFEQPYDVGWVEKMHADDPFRTGCAGCDLRDAERRSVGCQYRVLRYLCADLPKNLLLKSHSLGDRFDHEIDLLHSSVQVIDGGQAAHCQSPFVFVQFFAGNTYSQFLIDLLDGVCQNSGVDVEEPGGKSGQGADLGDSAAHCARTDHCNRLKSHHRFGFFAVKVSCRPDFGRCRSPQ